MYNYFIFVFLVMSYYFFTFCTVFYRLFFFSTAILIFVKQSFIFIDHQEHVIIPFNKMESTAVLNSKYIF